MFTGPLPVSGADPEPWSQVAELSFREQTWGFGRLMLMFQEQERPCPKKIEVLLLRIECPARCVNRNSQQAPVKSFPQRPTCAEGKAKEGFSKDSSDDVVTFRHIH